MENHESPETPFALFYQRVGVAPYVCIYDNGCHFDAFCRAREPFFFKHMQVYVDHLHWPNHRGCGPCYNSSKFDILDSINTQAAEQCNKTIRRIQSQVSYMSVEIFMLYTRYYLARVNSTRRTDSPNDALKQCIAKLTEEHTRFSFMY